MTSTDDEEVNSTVIAAIVIGSVGVVLMAFGSLLYFTRLGDVPSRRAVGNEPEKDIEKGEETVKTQMKQGTSGVGNDAPPSQRYVRNSGNQYCFDDSPFRPRFLILLL